MVLAAHTHLGHVARAAGPALHLDHLSKLEALCGVLYGG